MNSASSVRPPPRSHQIYCFEVTTVVRNQQLRVQRWLLKMCCCDSVRFEQVLRCVMFVQCHREVLLSSDFQKLIKVNWMPLFG